MASSTAKEKKPLRVQTAARGDVISIEVGPGKVQYCVHKALLIQHSKYFAETFKRTWREAEEGTVQLADVEPMTFGTFVDWLYTQKLPANNLEWFGLGSAPDGDQHRWLAEAQVLALKACEFGDRFLIPNFAQAVRYNLITQLLHDVPLYYETVIYAYANLAADDPLLKLFVHVQCNDFLIEETPDQLGLREQLPTRFLLDVMVRYSVLHSAYRPNDKFLKECDYHRHKSVAEKTACKKKLVDEHTSDSD